MAIDLAAETVANRVNTLHWALQTLDETCVAGGEDEGELRVFTDMVLTMITQEINNLASQAHDLRLKHLPPQTIRAA